MKRAVEMSIVEFGGVGDGVTSNTAAFTAAMTEMKKFEKKGGAQLNVPKGKWVTGSFNLTSNFTLFLEDGAVIMGSQVNCNIINLRIINMLIYLMIFILVFMELVASRVPNLKKKKNPTFDFLCWEGVGL